MSEPLSLLWGVSTCTWRVGDFLFGDTIMIRIRLKRQSNHRIPFIEFITTVDGVSSLLLSHTLNFQFKDS